MPPHLDLIEAIGVAGRAGGINDDRAGTGRHHAWVIDGATDLGPPGLLGRQGGAAWIAAAADRAFAAAPVVPLRTMVPMVFAEIARSFEAARTRDVAGRWELPSAAFLAVRLDGDDLEVAWLADCACLHLRGDVATRIGPQPSTAEMLEAATARSGGHSLAASGLAGDTLARQRVLRGRAERRTLGVEPDHAAAVHHDRAAIVPGDELVLMTDGLAALIDDYAMPVSAFVQALRGEGLHGLVARLRAIERDDADGQRFARFKRSDDATGLWLAIG